jgi:hypothetical protein
MSNIGSKLSNLWYHHKFKILIALFVVVVGGFLLYNYLDKPADLTIVVMSRSAGKIDVNTMRDFFEARTEDINGDGTRKVNILTTVLDENKSPEEQAEALRGSFNNPYVFLYIIDTPVCEELAEQFIESDCQLIGNSQQEKLGISHEDAGSYFEDGLQFVCRTRDNVDEMSVSSENHYMNAERIFWSIAAS